MECVDAVCPPCLTAELQSKLRKQQKHSAKYIINKSFGGLNEFRLMVHVFVWNQNENHLPHRADVFGIKGLFQLFSYFFLCFVSFW